MSRVGIPRQVRRTRIFAATVATIALGALSAAPAEAATSDGAVISNGTVQLGVLPQGNLNYDCASAADPVCPPPSVEGTSEVGLRFQALNLESTAPGCLCEGWGVADAASGLTGFANEAAGDANLTVESFTAPSADRAISIVKISDPTLPGFEMTVRQDYHPSPLTDSLFVDVVTITNTGTEPLADVRYRRVMDWDVEPTAFDEWVTNQGISPQLLFSSDDGFASSDPLDGPAYIDSEAVCGAGYTGPCEFKDLGNGGVYPVVTTADDHGGLFDFGFGALAPGESTRSFNVYYGAAPGEAEALAALSAGGAQVTSLGESNCTGDTIATCPPTGTAPFAGVEQGKPVTFMFGFTTTAADLAITKTGRPDPVPVGENLTYEVTVRNDGPEQATGVQVVDELPPGVQLVSATPTQGTCGGTSTLSCDLGTIANGASAKISIVVKPTATGTITNIAGVSSASFDENQANNKATALTRVVSGVCRGKTITIDGTKGDDVITGTPKADVISGDAGNDRIKGLEGNDVICGRGGKDKVSGDEGKDQLLGGKKNDTVKGGDDNDFVRGQTGRDKLTGGDGNDKLVANKGADTLKANAGDDKLLASNGNDKLFGGPGNDLLDGGKGDNRCVPGSGNNKLRNCD